MANRQDSGSPSAHPQRRPGQSDDSMPEMNEDVRNQADDSEDDDEFEDTDDLDEDDDRDEDS